MKQDSQSVIYMLDTNILIEWASTFTPDFDNADKHRKKSKMRIKAFCEENQNRIVVPDLVWVEFLSVILHRDINVEDDYKSCLLKFRNKQSLVQ